MPQTNIGVLTDEQMAGQLKLFPSQQEPMNTMTPVVDAKIDEDM